MGMRLLLVAVFAVVGLAGCAEKPFYERKIVMINTDSGTFALQDAKFYQAGILGQRWVQTNTSDTNSPSINLGTRFFPWQVVQYVHALADPHASPPVLDTPR